MSIIQSFGKMFRGKNTDNSNSTIDFDIDGRPLYKDDIIRKITDELARRKDERFPLEQQWHLNANFLVGNQYCDYNNHRGRIEQIEPAFDWLERDTFNRIAPLIETRIANLKKINYLMRVKPRTNELDDYSKAEVSSTILQYLQSISDFNMKKNTAISWNELCGNCFWLSWWDPSKGDKYATETIIETDENGNISKKEKTYCQGELDYGLITPWEIYPESIFKQTIDAQRSIILEQVKTVDEIYDLYGIKVDGSTVDTFELTPVTSGGGFGYENNVMSLGIRTVDNSEKIITYFERPSRHRPNGLMIILVGLENLVYYGDLPYTHIPICQMICREVPGQFFGKSAIEDLIPLQRAYNGCVNRIHEYIKRVAINSYFVEAGSVDVDDFLENGCAPGSVVEYERGSQRPIPNTIGNLPSELTVERDKLKNDMEYVAGTSQLMVNGVVPSGITSGTAIQNLMEIDNTRLSLTGDYLRNSIKNLAVIWLEIYKRYANTNRIVNYVGKNNIGNAIMWNNKDINSYDVEFLTENELLTSEDMQKENFFNAFKMGLFTDANGVIPERVKHRALEFMKINNYSDLMSINTLQVQAAQRENTFFENGALPEVSDFDEHQIHIEEHMRYILQMDFQILKKRKPEYAKALENHIRIHQQMLSNREQSNAIAQIIASQQKNK